MIVSLWHSFQCAKTFNFHCQFKCCPLPSPGKTGEQPKRKLRRARETQNNVSCSWATMMMWPVKRWPPVFFSFSKFCCPPPTVRALMARYQLSIPARPFKAHTPPTTWLSATGNRQIRAELEPVGRRLCQKKDNLSKVWNPRQARLWHLAAPGHHSGICGSGLTFRH